MLTKFGMRDICLRLLCAFCIHRYGHIKRSVYLELYVCFTVHSVPQMLLVNIVYQLVILPTDHFIFFDMQLYVTLM